METVVETERQTEIEKVIETERQRQTKRERERHFHTDKEAIRYLQN